MLKNPFTWNYEEARIATPNRSCIDSNIKRRTTTTPVDHQTRFDLKAKFSPHTLNRQSDAAHPSISRNKVSYELG